jgi:ribosomal protein S18 acetylase RimI-like enzyme
VATDRHGRGLGRALLSECADRACRDGCDVLWLGVWDGNDRAIGFYERLGLRRVGATQFRLGSELQTDLLMVLPLTQG